LTTLIDVRLALTRVRLRARMRCCAPFSHVRLRANQTLEPTWPQDRVWPRTGHRPEWGSAPQHLDSEQNEPRFSSSLVFSGSPVWRNPWPASFAWGLFLWAHKEKERAPGISAGAQDWPSWQPRATSRHQRHPREIKGL